MDAQDAQDNRAGTLLQGKLALAMIGQGIADAREWGTADSKSQILCILCIDVNKDMDRLAGKALRRKLTGSMISCSRRMPGSLTTSDGLLYTDSFGFARQRSP